MGKNINSKLLSIILCLSLGINQVFSQDISEISINEPTYYDKIINDPYFFLLLTILGIGVLILSVFNSLSHLLINGKLATLDNNTKIYEYELKELVETAVTTKKIIVFLLFLVPAFYLFYIAIKGTSSQGHFTEWLNLIVRWIHVIAGIMWIGASFYFIFLENNLNRTKEVRDELAGNLWAIHGGGFYFLEKYKIAPKQIPKDLHWFKYEAYFTWLSGIMLLWIVYYMDAKAYLLDPSVSNINSITGISIGIGSMLIGWIIYDFMCKSPLIKNTKMFGIVGMILLIGISYFFTHIFSGRAAFIHVGALIGTIMAWNVYFVIIPAQKAMVKAAIAGLPLDATLGQKAGQRSLHNNYFTLPLIFIMLSNHYPSTFGNTYNWVILMVITLSSAGIKHYWNLIERGVKLKFILPVSIIAMFGLAVITSPMFEDAAANAVPTPFSEVQPIMQARCVQCHSANPTDKVWKTAPNGVAFDTPEQIQNMSEKIMARAVRSNSMPQGNITNMTDDERLVLKRWILQGAKID